MMYLLAALTIVLFSGIMVYVLNHTVNRYKPNQKRTTNAREFSPAPFQSVINNQR
ncbi:hypothetical protein LC040_09110 [Bacillus tianshenii]|nr:hypothetical protein LC040_09110 [Bacillus tianshenii]